MNKVKLKFEKLELTRINLTSLFNSIDKQGLTFKSNPEKWSIIQICFHVIKSEQLAIIVLNKNLKLKDNLKKRGFLGIIRDHSLSFALKAKIKFKAPAIVANPPETYDFQELMKKWETIRISLKNYIEVFPEQYLNKEIYNHPIAGWLNLSQTLNFLQNHFDHHKPQIEKRIKEYNILKQ